jgi:hypothetical protein
VSSRYLGWRRIDGRKGKCWARWLHLSGAIVQHCGHPTAHRPWYAWLPSGRKVVERHDSGGGAAVWTRLHEAMRAAEAAARQEAQESVRDGWVVCAVLDHVAVDHLASSSARQGDGP